MSHKNNYSKLFQKEEKANVEEVINEPEVVEDEVIEEIVENPIVDPVVETEAEQVQEIVEESPVVEEPVVEEPVVQTIGFVDGCNSLRVRKESSVDSEELCIIAKSTEVVIDLENSTEDFYKVTTSEGVEGYCMKKFITIK